MTREDLEKFAAFFDLMPVLRRTGSLEKAIQTALAEFAIDQINKALDEAIEAAQEHRCRTYSELCDCGAKISSEISALKIK